MNVAYCCNCLGAMKKLPDGYADLVVADPPYGINRFKNGETSRLRKCGSLESVNNFSFTEEMFNEMRRISKNQIIFGFNHLCDVLPPTSEFIFWYKHQPVETYSDGELAWTSFNKTAKCFDYPFFGSHGADDDKRISPAQKPVALYKWIYNQYLPNGGGGSRSVFRKRIKQNCGIRSWIGLHRLRNRPNILSVTRRTVCTAYSATKPIYRRLNVRKTM